MSEIKPPRHRHEMTLHVGGNTNEQLADRLRKIADDIELHDIDGERDVTSSDGYAFTVEHDPAMGPERYAIDLDVWWQARKAARTEAAR